MSAPRDTTIGILTASIPLCYAAFAVLRSRQLSLPDPYSNSYTTWSTAFLGAFVVAWVADLVALLRLSRGIRSTTKLAGWSIVALGAIEIGWSVVSMVRFVEPGWF